MGCWNEHYRGSSQPWTRPDSDLVAEAARLEPGRALDLGCGEGADSLWLAAAGWEVTSVDCAPGAIETLRRLAEEQGLQVDGVVADFFEYAPEPRYDLVTLCYLHVWPQQRGPLLATATAAVAPGGALLYIAITRPERPGEQDLPPELLARPEEIAHEVETAGLTVERCDARRRTVGCPEGDFAAEVMVVRARRDPS